MSLISIRYVILHITVTTMHCAIASMQGKTSNFYIFPQEIITTMSQAGSDPVVRLTQGPVHHRTDDAMERMQLVKRMNVLPVEVGC